jgi:hypothetical protein
LLSRLASFEEDGVTHRRDCGCARCDAGFGPSEHERADAQRRWDEKRARAVAERAAARKREAERLRRAEVDLYLNDQLQATDQGVRSLRALEDRVRHDPRLDELSRLRRAGLPLREALAEIDRRFPPLHAGNNTESDG